MTVMVLKKFLIMNGISFTKIAKSIYNLCNDHLILHAVIQLVGVNKSNFELHLLEDQMNSNL